MHKAIIIFLTISLVSLFADIVYEGGRSISGTFLDYLGAPAIAAGVLAVGEFLGYAIRLPVGIAISSKKSSKFLWVTIISGYMLILAIPFLAFVNDWRYALALYLIERIGKGFRTPARDIVIADITDKSIGKGKAFGIHELLDQIGALLGPLIMSFAIISNGYSYAYILLLPAALIAILLITTASTLYPHIDTISNSLSKLKLMNKNSKIKSYTIFISFLSFGLIHWSLVSYHLSYAKIIPQNVIPLLYALAMIVDALIAVPLGIAYDKYGLYILVLLPLLSIPIAPIFLLSKNMLLLILGSILFGIMMCSYDSVLRAGIADIALPHERALGFGWLGFVWGISWGLGNIAGGVIYDMLGSYMLCIIYPAISLAAFIYMIKVLYKNIDTTLIQTNKIGSITTLT